MPNSVDLNCDMGESFGMYTIGADEQLMPYITSANIACGAHAGDPAVMDRTVRLAKENDVAVGAHPGLPDLAGFGRRMMDVAPEEVYQMVVYQIGALQAFCKVHNVEMQHVKPHGALYNVAAKNRDTADAVARAVHDVNDELVLFGLAGSKLLTAGKQTDLQVASEIFADRTYQADGSLTPRQQPDALIENADDAVRQVERILRTGNVRAVTGEDVTIVADTICVHGDGAQAAVFAGKLRTALQADGIAIKAISSGGFN
ncbi:UPF0271 protein YcsF [Lentibacillus kapialis]|uniref:5-oxoprolinase subunit A n=1 Tax=Lentibacillus kapialis TaxID=340214 RepID=A0A917V197_9BACI|nr:5-oxoprolinase subunit PxpA [Lentibacillus kapialis]GGK07675.1 UPF0271 protein YcsF [Lentibacillus kapialis]